MKVAKLISSILTLLLIVHGLMAQEKSPNITGTWKRTFQGMTLILEFDKDQNYKVDFNNDGNIDVSGNYNIEKDQIIFFDKTGQAAKEPGRYTYILKEENLSFSIVDDPSPGRTQLLPGIWSRIMKKND